MKKYKLGQFFTKKNYWKKKQILDFIYKYKFKNILDPFAGDGGLLKEFKKDFKIIGYDIDENLNWKYNDSLKNIKYIKDTFIVTNPPYLSRVSNKRKGINNNIFNETKFSDLYQVALDKIIESGMPGVAIVPETFINSKFSKKHIFSITILIPNPFEDTETPVCIICFDPNQKFEDTIIYKNDKKIGNLKKIKELSEQILKSNKKLDIKFNDEDGDLALIGFDSTLGKEIRFLKSSELNYKKPIKISSRVITKIKIKDQIINSDFIVRLNEKLKHYRKKTNSVLLSPFKGNIDDNFRRRRLDFKTARKIINSI